MTSLTIGWEYLTGYSVASEKMGGPIEWPPHPGRVFMALAAAWFETEAPLEDSGARQAWEAEGDALRWLETMGDPDLRLPRVEREFARSNVTVYVPVNDRAGPAAASLQSVPALTRSKQARSFPRVWVSHEPCSMHWRSPDDVVVKRHCVALDRLCLKVTRIGHSSSLVRMWATCATNEEPQSGGAADQLTETWIADDGLAEHHCRVVTPGTLDTLPVQTQIPRILRFAAMDTRIRSSTGKEHKQAKAEFERAFEQNWKTSVSPPPLLRPKLGISKGYRRAEAGPTDTQLRHSLFDTDMLVLKDITGPRLPAVSTLAVTRALRATILKHVHQEQCGCDRWKDNVLSAAEAAECYAKIPPWVSGHEPNGEPLRSETGGHMAIIPLPFVGHEHADGHLLGVGLVFPRAKRGHEQEARRERGRVLGRLLIDLKTGEPRDAKIELKLGSLGVWTIEKRKWDEPAHTLDPEVWTGQRRRRFDPDGKTWASVTPVVLDRFPKADRSNPEERLKWEEEVRETIAAACARIGLPEPSAIDIDTTSWHLGSPRATSKRRPLRGHIGISNVLGATCGDGFPPYPAKGTNSPRPQIHVWLRFPAPVVGPVLLGAGRYLGYGLCRPLIGDGQ